MSRHYGVPPRQLKIDLTVSVLKEDLDANDVSQDLGGHDLACLVMSVSTGGFKHTRLA